MKKTCECGNIVEITENSKQECSKCGNDFASKIEIPDSMLDTVAGEESQTASALWLPDIKELFGPFKLLKMLGRGGMGVVYKALDTQVDRIVALKVILYDEKNDSMLHKRFQKEMQMLAQLQHPNIVKLLSVGQTPQNYFTMEYIDGKGLHQIDQKKPRRIAQIFQKVAKALHSAHQLGIVHRDLKPSNIMLDKHEEPKLMDFGLAKITSESAGLSKTGDIIGTIVYMSPEQATGSKLDHTTDIYSLGATLYHLLTGRPPFQGDHSVNVLYQIMERDPISPTSLNPDIPFDLEAICLKCLEKSPQKRYKDALQMAQDLDNFCENRPIIAKKPSSFDYVRKFVLRNKLPCSLGLGFFFCLLLGIGFYILFLQKEEKRQRLAHRLAYTHLAKISLERAKEEAISQKWQASGVFAGTSLEYVKNFSGIDIDLLREQAKKLVRTSLYNYNLLWSTARFFQVGHIAYSPDGKILATAEPPAQKDLIRVWDSSGRFISVASDHHGTITDLCFSPNGRFLASVAQDGVMRIWDFSKNKETARIRVHADAVYSVCYNANGKLLVTASKDQYIHIWDTKTLQKLYEFKEKIAIHRTIFHPKKDLLAIFFKDGSVKLRSISSTQTQIIPGKSKDIDFGGLAFSPNGQFLAITSLAATEIWSINQNAPKKLFTFKENLQRENSFTPTANPVQFADNKRVLTCGSRSIHLWNLATGKLIYRLQGYFPNIYSLTVAKNKLIISDGTLQMWDLNSGKMLTKIYGHTNSIDDLIFSHDGNWLASKDYQGKIIVWKIATGKIIAQFDQKQGTVYTFAFSPQNKSLLLHLGNKLLQWDFHADKISEKLILPENFALSGLLSVDGALLLSQTDENEKAMVLDTATGKILRTFKATNIAFMALSRDKTKLAVSCQNREIYLWNVKTGQMLQKFSHHKGRIRTMAFNFQGNMLASADSETAFVWKTSGEKIATFSVNVDIKKLAFHPNGKILSASCKDIILWEICSGKEIRRFSHNGKNDFARTLAFNPSGELLASSFVTSLKVWDVSLNNKTIEPSTYGYHQALFSPNGENIVLLGNEKAILWSLKLQKQLWQSKGENPSDPFFNSDKKVSIAFWPRLEQRDILSGKMLSQIANLPGSSVPGKGKMFAHIRNIFFSKFDPKKTAIEIWDLTKKKSIFELKAPGERAKYAMFSPDGSIFAAFYANRTLYLWDTKTQREIVRIARERASKKAWGFSPDSKFLAYAHTPHIVKIYHIAKKKVVQQINSLLQQVLVVAISNKTLALCSKKRVSLWDLSSGRQIYHLPLYTTGVHFITISPDNSTLVVLPNGKPIEFWDISNVHRIRRFTIENYHLSNWAKTFATKYQITFNSHKSFFDFRWDIPGNLLEKGLKQAPKEMSQRLFYLKVNETLTLDVYPMWRLFQKKP